MTPQHTGKTFTKTIVAVVTAIVVMSCFIQSALAQRDAAAARLPLQQQAAAAMRKAADYYVGNVARHGGYVYHYTLDLKTRWGEGLAEPDAIWVQPPGTPTVGMALLAAYRATGDPFYLESAKRAAEALAYGQLRSGGWTNSVNLSKRQNEGFRFEGGKRRRDGNSSLDDGQSQSAIQFMVEMDGALSMKNPIIHDSASVAVSALLKAQFPNGAFPQVWTKPVEPQPIVSANYPEYDWRTEGRIKNYWDMYTLNDNVCGYVTDALLTAHHVYNSDACMEAVKRLGDFLILAQMPEPQPGWAQQYNYAMQPIWARRFEPPGVSGDESQEAIETLMKIYQVTGDKKYLAPIPRALDYLERSTMTDGQVARYYELQTNKPLYMKRNGKQYTLTHDDSQLPKHYGWKTESRVAELRARHAKLIEAANRGAKPPKIGLAPVSKARVEEVLRQLDDQGRWISVHSGERLVGQPKFAEGDRYLSSQVFSDNLVLLARFLHE